VVIESVGARADEDMMCRRALSASVMDLRSMNTENEKGRQGTNRMYEP